MNLRQTLSARTDYRWSGGSDPRSNKYPFERARGDSWQEKGGEIGPVLVLRQRCETSVGVCPASCDCLGLSVLHTRSIILLPPLIRMQVGELCESQLGRPGLAALLVAQLGVPRPALRKRVPALYCLINPSS